MERLTDLQGHIKTQLDILLFNLSSVTVDDHELSTVNHKEEQKN